MGKIVPFAIGVLLAGWAMSANAGQTELPPAPKGYHWSKCGKGPEGQIACMDPVPDVPLQAATPAPPPAYPPYWYGQQVISPDYGYYPVPGYYYPRRAQPMPFIGGGGHHHYSHPGHSSYRPPENLRHYRGSGTSIWNR